jgi:hypothetical protein
MNLLTRTRRPRPAARRRRAAGLAVESIEKRLAPSPTLPLPPPHVSGLVAHVQPPDPCAAGGGAGKVRLSPSFEPPDPCARLAPSFQPPDPCARLAPNFFPPQPI